MFDEAFKILLGYGPAGLAIGLLILAIIRIDNRRNDEIEARLKDALDWQTTVTNNTDAMEKITEEQKETNRVIEALAVSNRAISESINILVATIRSQKGP